MTDLYLRLCSALHSPSLSLDDLSHLYQDLLMSNALCTDIGNGNLLIIEELVNNAICLLELGEETDAKYQLQSACFILNMD